MRSFSVASFEIGENKPPNYRICKKEHVNQQSYNNITYQCDVPSLVFDLVLACH